MTTTPRLTEAEAKARWDAERAQLKREGPDWWTMPAWSRAPAWRRAPYYSPDSDTPSEDAR